MTDKKKLLKYISELETKIQNLETNQKDNTGLECLSKDKFFDQVPIGIVIFELLDKDDISKTKIYDVNKYFERIANIKKKDILDKNITELINKSFLPSNLYDDIFKNEKIIEIKTSLINKEKHFNITFFKTNEKSFIASFNDYTQLKEAKDTIVFERNLFQTLLNKFPDAIYFKDKNAKFLRASLHMTQIFHTTPNEIIGKSDYDFFNKNLADKKFNDDMKVIKTGIPLINKEEKGSTSDNINRWVSTTKLPLFNRKGEIEGLFGISRDITDRKLAEKNETEYKNNLITLSECAINLLKINTKEEIFISLSSTLERHFKYSMILYSLIKSDGNSYFETSLQSDEHNSLKDLLNKNNIVPFIINHSQINELLFKGKIISCNRDIKDCFNIDEIENKFDALDIKHKYILSITQENKVIGLFLILMKNGIRLIDKNFVNTFIQQSSLIVYRKNLEEQLIIEKNRAEESDKLKTSFLANLSHEIRTPINAIQGFGELLKIDDLPFEKKKEYIDIIQEKSSQLIQIIGDIIDISKFESNQVKVTETEESLNDFLLNIISDFEYKLANYIKKDIPLFLNKGLDDNNCTYKTDFSLLRQVIVNLISNAIKFTHDGLIELGYEVNSNHIEFYVQDTGIGIPEEKREVVFVRFRQVDDSRTRKYGGTGLGLTISKNIINLLNGKIWIEESDYEKFENKNVIDKSIENIRNKELFGSRFVFTLPYSQIMSEVKEVVPSKKELSDWKSVNILVVEDDSFNYQYIYEVLDTNEPNLIHCKNGKEALNYFNEHEDEIHLILMDLQMPVMDGFEATRIIRGKNQEIPIIVQTAYAMPEDITKANEAGATDYIVKPYNSVELIDKITKYISG